MAVDLRELVRAERRRLGLSVRAAATRGGCANTTWSAWESGKNELGAAVQAAVTLAFDWPADWPTNPPTPPTPAESGQPSNAELLAILQKMRSVAVDTNLVLRLMAENQGVVVPARMLRAEDLREEPGGRRRDDRRHSGSPASVPSSTTRG